MAHLPRTPKPLTAEQRRQHAAFLKHLARTGNARQSAAAIGMNDSTLLARRKRHPEFATRWDATLAAAHARLSGAGGARPAGGSARTRRAAEGEITVSVLKSGRLQVRRARADAVTRADEQRFLLALSATANVTLAAAAAGASPAAFNKRRRANPAFAREMRAALEEGWRRLEGALIEGWSPLSGENAEWRDNDPPAIPPMTPAQALKLLAMHQRGVKWARAAQPARLLPGETPDLRSARLRRLHRARQVAEAEAAVEGEWRRSIARVERVAERIALPDLAQVKGGSNADPAKTAAQGGKPHGGAMREKLTEEARARGRASRGRKR